MAPDFSLLAFNAAPVAIVLTEQRVIRACNETFAAAVNWLACPACAGTETKVVGGDEMVLASVELDVDDPQEAMPAAAEETIRHV